MNKCLQHLFILTIVLTPHMTYYWGKLVSSELLQVYSVQYSVHLSQVYSQVATIYSQSGKTAEAEKTFKVWEQHVQTCSERVQLTRADMQ